MAEYYMFNKPVGCITARRDERHKTVMDYFPEEKRDVLFPVGRLDKDTEGLLIITDDGKLIFKPNKANVGSASAGDFHVTVTCEAESENGMNTFTVSIPLMR